MLVPGLLAAQGPAVGDVAPNFTLPVASSAGVAAQPLTLSSLKGQTVVLAFFPRARTRGCTIQMESYRDRYTELFGANTQLIAISTDTPGDLAAWASDEAFPFRFAADTAGTAARLYGAMPEGRNSASRVLYVVGPSGRITGVMRPFAEIDPTAYDSLKVLVERSAQD